MNETSVKPVAGAGHEVPIHLTKYPCMKPWVGCRYQSPTHKRLLVMGESHYMDNYDGIDKKAWYERSCKEIVDPDQIAYISTASIVEQAIIGGAKMHPVYKEIAYLLKGSGVPCANGDDDHCVAQSLHEIAYINFYMRPAWVKGKGISGITPQDIAVAQSVLRWNLATLRPDVVVMCTRTGGVHAKPVLDEYGKPSCFTCHPSARNRKKWDGPCPEYGNMTGYEHARVFLLAHQWYPQVTAT
jgi:hypothetical protein